MIFLTHMQLLLKISLRQEQYSTCTCILQTDVDEQLNSLCGKTIVIPYICLSNYVTASIFEVILSSLKLLQQRCSMHDCPNSDIVVLMAKWHWLYLLDESGYSTVCHCASPASNRRFILKRSQSHIDNEF